jgi:hydroxymethylpyrimidine/phosphomethylpyrimidine kinase
MVHTHPVVLTIAGFDPSSGAGVTADTKTIAAHGCYGIACITAITVQSTSRVRRVRPVAATLVRETLTELAADIDITAVHVGMLANADVAKVVADFLAKQAVPNVVLDPVLKSSSGARLLDRAGTRVLIEQLIPLASVVTPNVEEAAALTGLLVRNLEEMGAAAAKLHEMGAVRVVVTGGHADPAVDLLSYRGAKGIGRKVFSMPQQRSRSTHGTGCAFATALACNLAQGRNLPAAVRLAKSYVAAAIASAYPVGKGTGPVNHMYVRGK